MTAKQSISNLHAKYYGGGKKKADPVAKVVKTKAVDQVNAKLAKAGLPIKFVSSKKEADQEIPLLGKTTRSSLMLEAKAKGIKYFRVLNKDELIKVLDMKKSGASDEQIAVITEAAKIRWQAGWSKNKKI